MGSLAPEGSVIGHAVCLKDVFEAVLHARPFGSKKEDPDAIPTKPKNPNSIPTVDGFGFFLLSKN